MKINYKEFYQFINIVSPKLVKLWEDINNRADPQKGDMYKINESKIVRYKNIFFDSEFKNGVAFYYIFEDISTGEKIRLHSINDVYDPSILTKEEINDLFRFWTHCIPYIENQ